MQPDAPEPGQPAPETQHEHKLRQLFDRSFELEMLISGAIIFLLFGITQRADEWIDTWRNYYASEDTKTTIVVLVMGRAVIYLVLSVLILHLVLRSFWVGLVGLTSVFPGGVRPENAQGGPYMKDFVRRNTKSLFELSTNVDRWCRLIYSIAFIMLLQYGGAVGIILITGTIGIPLSKYFFPHIEPYWLGLMLFGILFIPAGLLILLDRLIGKWSALAGLRNNESLRRVFHFVYHFQKLISLQGLIGTVAYTVFTNITRRQLLVGIFVVIMGLYFFMFQGLGIFELNRDLFLPPRENPTRLRAAHYENLNEKPLPFLPTIQADIVKDDYLRLFLPIDTRYADTLLTRYPQLKPSQDVGVVLFSPYKKLTEEQVKGNMQALAQLFTVRLDSTMQNNLAYGYYVHPQTEVAGLLAYLPVAALPQGRHQLHIQVHYKSEPLKYTIPFYR
jgi:hypothetical protein